MNINGHELTPEQILELVLPRPLTAQPIFARYTKEMEDAIVERLEEEERGMEHEEDFPI